MSLLVGFSLMGGKNLRLAAATIVCIGYPALRD